MIEGKNSIKTNEDKSKPADSKPVGNNPLNDVTKVEGINTVITYSEEEKGGDKHDCK